MTDKDTGGPAFPMPSGPEPRVNDATHFNEGMTLRDYFAGQALAAMHVQAYGSFLSIAKEAYKVADAMLEERTK